MNALTRLAIRSALPAVVLAVAGVATPAAAQNIGTFPFALQPYCNIVTVTVTQEGSTYRLAGWDDACGANERLPVRGTIAPNLDGTLHISFSATRPNGISVETSVRNFVVGPYSGSFTDSAGNTGTFVLAGAPGGSGARPGPSTTLPSNSVTTINIVDNSITAVDVDPTQVQLRVSGVCPAGQAVQSVNQGGTVVCIVAGGGGGSSTSVTLSDELSPINGLSTTCEDISAITFGTVAAGTLTCSGSVHVSVNHATATVSRLEFDFATTAAACGGTQASVFEIPAEMASVTGHDASVHVQRAIPVTAGALTARLNARAVNTFVANELAHNVTCTFTPQ